MKKKKGKYFEKKDQFDSLVGKIFLTIVIVFFTFGALGYVIDYVKNGEGYVPSLGYGYIFKSSRAIVMGSFIVVVIIGLSTLTRKKKK